MVLGVYLILIGAILHDWIKKKQKSKEKQLAAGMLALLGLFIFIASNIITIVTYLQISKLNKPVSATKNIDTIYVGQDRYGI